jgi:hypothetical protein
MLGNAECPNTVQAYYVDYNKKTNLKSYFGSWQANIN